MLIKGILIKLIIDKEEINLNNKSSSDNKSSLNNDLKYKTLIFNVEYNKESIKITIYLIIFKKSKDINIKKFYKFKKKY